VHSLCPGTVGGVVRFKFDPFGFGVNEKDGLFFSLTGVNEKAGLEVG